MLLTAVLLALGVHQGTLPGFADFPADVMAIATPAAPDLGSHPMARRYRTMLSRAAKQRPDFAGHYTIARIGCGVSCIQIAVIDSTNGHVYFPTDPEIVQWAGWWHDPYGPQYLLSGRLLVVYGVVGADSDAYGATYFLWDGSAFKRLAFRARDRGSPPK
jgi:hypothetical protein